MEVQLQSIGEMAAVTAVVEEVAPRLTGEEMAQAPTVVEEMVVPSQQALIPEKRTARKKSKVVSPVIDTIEDTG